MTSWRERRKLNFAARMKDYRRYLHTTKRSKIIGSYALILFCSIYFSCFLYYGFRKLSYSLNPVTLWRDHNQYGVPWLLIVLFAVLFWMGYIMIVTHKYNKKKEDPRNFSYSESGVYGTAGTLTEEAMADIARVDNIKVARGMLILVHVHIPISFHSLVVDIQSLCYWSWYGFGSRVEWCACFVSWCADQCGYIETGVCPKYAGCVNGVAWFQERDQWLDGSATPSRA